MAARQLSALDLEALRPADGYFASPIAWEDQVFYFLMVDRFSDGKETGYRDFEGNVVTSGSTPLFRSSDRGNAVRTEADAAAWREAGARYVGGTLNGLRSKIGYLRRMGVTALWISPIFKQVAFQDTYHGYGIQDFLEVNSEFGTMQDLKDLVKTAHANGIYVILDIILNHTGNVFGYDPGRQPHYDDGGGHFDPRWDGGSYPVLGFRDRGGSPALAFQRTDPSAPGTWPETNSAVWPVEFQDPSVFTRKGRINNWDWDPEYLEGDFFDLKDLYHGQGGLDQYVPSPTLLNLCKVYQYWMALADVDGFRIDTVKHMDMGATRYFAASIHEFAQTIGKENFYLIGEITGGRSRAFYTLSVTGLDAALGIDDIPDKLEYMVKGYRDPNEYFGLFRNSVLVDRESHTWFRNKVVTVLDDHDQVRKGQNKARFCADSGGDKLVLSALALNAMTIGIPCIYYGTEQCFDGHGDSDRYLREAMFGGDFGAFASRGRHFFDEDASSYRELAKILAIRRLRPVLRRGRQYLREISGDGVSFGLPRMIGDQIRSVIPWSRVLHDKEMLLAINTDPDARRDAWATIDANLNRDRRSLTCLYSTDPNEIGKQIPIEPHNGLAVPLSVPAAGFVIYE